MWSSWDQRRQAAPRERPVARHAGGLRPVRDRSAMWLRPISKAGVPSTDPHAGGASSPGYPYVFVRKIFERRQDWREPIRGK